MRRRATLPLLLAAGCLSLGLAGCSSASEPEVQKVAAVFENPAVDPQSRCDLLAPMTREVVQESSPCAGALRQLPFRGGAVRSVQVWGGGAQAKVGSDTVFLTQTDAGWKVTAALCKPRGDAPYECQVEGP